MITLDESKVQSYVFPNIEKSKKYILDASNVIKTLNNVLPRDYYHLDDIRNCDSKLQIIAPSIDTIKNNINKKIETAEQIERKGNQKTGALASLAAAIGKGLVTTTGAAITTSKIVSDAAKDIKNNDTNKTGAKETSKGFLSGLKSLGGKLVEGIKNVGAKVVNGVKSVGTAIKSTITTAAKKVESAADWVGDKIKGAVDWGKKALEKTGAFVSNVGKTLWSGAKNLFNKAVDFGKKVGASIANAAISLVKGLVSLVEAIGDLAVLVVSGVGTIGTGIYDIGYGIATGNWDFKATKGLWDGTKSVVSYEWTNKIFDAFYNTEVGKTLDKYAYAPFKSDGIACKIGEGIGYVAGVIAITIATFGVGGVAIGGASGVSATTMAMTATAAGIGKYTAEEWNKNSISLNYNGQDINFALNYEKYSEIENLKNGESTTISQQIQMEDGTIFNLEFTITGKGNGQYEIVDNVGNAVSLNSLNESSTAKGLFVGSIKGGWEGLQWYVGGKINGLFKGTNSTITNKFVGSLARVGLDSLTGMAEVPFQTIVTMLSEGKSWNEAWEASGGWRQVGIQASIGALASGFGEGIDFLTGSIATKKIISALDNASPQADNIITKQLSKLSDLDVKQLLDGADDITKMQILKNLEPSRLANFKDLVSEEIFNDLEVYHNFKTITNLDAARNVSSPQVQGPVDFNTMQELKYNKDQLDQICEVLDEWGRQHGVDNYSQTALRKYAETGSAYQMIDGRSAPYITSANGARSYIETLDPDIVSAYLHYKTIDSSNLGKLGQFFNGVRSFNGDTYGADQGGIKSLCTYSLDGQYYSYYDAKNMVNNAKNNGLPIPKFKKVATLEYFELKDKLMRRGLTNEQASVILSSLDDVGACSYAAKANSIFYKFADNPALFEECFGFPMYKVTRAGERVLNSNELLLDMYMYANDTVNGGNLFTRNSLNGTYTFNYGYNSKIDALGRPMLDTENQIYMSTSKGSNDYALSNYLRTKNLDWNSVNLITNDPNVYIPNDSFNQIIDTVNNSINNGKAVQLNIFSKGNEIRMINADPRFSVTTSTWGEGGGHAIFITGINRDSFVVSSWGKEFIIPFKDLQNGGFFNIMIDDVKPII